MIVMLLSVFPFSTRISKLVYDKFDKFGTSAGNRREQISQDTTRSTLANNVMLVFVFTKFGNNFWKTLEGMLCDFVCL